MSCRSAHQKQMSDDRKTNHICKKCQVNIGHLHYRAVFCSKECKKDYARDECIRASKNENFDTTDVECKVCGFRAQNLSFHIMKTHSMQVSDYHEQYKTTSKDIMSERLLRIFSSTISGDKNPWHNHGGQLSIFSKKANCYKHLTADERDEAVLCAQKDANAKFTKPSMLTYWTNKGCSLDEAREKVKQSQSTFSLQKCILRYGETEGLLRWQQRQEKWHKNFKKSNYSKISQKLFKALNELMNGTECIFAECYDNNRNNEQVFRSVEGPVYKLDFYVPTTKHVIEFDGTYWHNKNKESTTTISNRDKIRDNNILSTDCDIKIMHVKEADYCANPEKVIEQCLAFLKS